VSAAKTPTTAFVLIAVGIALAVAAGSPGAAPGAPRQRAVVDHVADGDTIKVVINGRGEYVRFIGIDTPEVYDGVDCGGPEASASMKRLLKPGDRVRLVRDFSQDNRDVYGRLLRYVEFEGRDLGRKQVTKGWARVYVFDQPFDRLAPYDRSQDQAEGAGRGVWGECGGF
jgi:endonuclease YncB( thermonuclease family)